MDDDADDQYNIYHNNLLVHSTYSSSGSNSSNLSMGNQSLLREIEEKLDARPLSDQETLSRFVITSKKNSAQTRRIRTYSSSNEEEESWPTHDETTTGDTSPWFNNTAITATSKERRTRARVPSRPSSNEEESNNKPLARPEEPNNGAVARIGTKNISSRQQQPLPTNYTLTEDHSCTSLQPPHSGNHTYHHHFSPTSSFIMSSTSNNSSSSVPQIYTKSSGNDPNDPMNRYDTVAPELGVGLERWKAIRQAWVTGAFCKDKKTIPSNSQNEDHRDSVDVDAIVEHLVNPKKPSFQKPIPLNEMIQILLEIWESDGLFE